MQEAVVDVKKPEESESDDDFALPDASSQIPAGVPLFKGGAFYVRYYFGQTSKQHGREFLEFDFRPDGLMRYANESAYRDSTIIRKQAYVSFSVLEELLSFVLSSNILECSDAKWPKSTSPQSPQTELEVIAGTKHVCLVTATPSSFDDVAQSADPTGLKTFYYLTQDIRAFALSLIQFHFRLQPY